ncbi:MAG TPA: hypothetical protein VNM92_02545 [Thermoanaerobaculia bacterium]|nr:hypothetical protein [Thermoanaerobaculia bacterium]
MSRINGEKARAAITRKRRTARRVIEQEMRTKLIESRAAGVLPPEPKSKTKKPKVKVEEEAGAATAEPKAEAKKKEAKPKSEAKPKAPKKKAAES